MWNPFHRSKAPGQDRRKSYRRFTFFAIVILLLGGVAFYLYNTNSDMEIEITDQLGGNIFPSAILATATTDAQIVEPVTPSLGNAKSSFAVRVKSLHPGTKVRIELEETQFFGRSVTEFILPKGKTYYTLYPDILWRYDALRNNEQAEPISVSVEVERNGKSIGHKMRTFSVRSINECLLGYIRQLDGNRTTFVSTRQLFAAYVNEENPQIDKLLREALNTRIVRRFQGYQVGTPASVDKQVYALWHILQKRHFRYSSVSYSTLSSNLVYSQRVRTFEDALNSSQINCVDGSALFASLLRAIDITPVLVQTPGHMFVGYYTDTRKDSLTFLETTMIGDVELDDYFPEERLDSTIQGKSQEEMSRLTFQKSKEYATKAFHRNEKKIRGNEKGYMFLEISKGVRRKIQPIGK